MMHTDLAHCRFNNITGMKGAGGGGGGGGVAQQRVHQAVRGNALGWRADGQATWSGGNLHGCLNHTADNSAAFDAGLSDDLSIMCWRQFHCRE